MTSTEKAQVQRLLHNHEILYNSLFDLLVKLTKGGGIRTNPYAVPEVKAALTAIAEIRGVGDYLDAVG